jgi:adenylate cyclase
LIGVLGEHGQSAESVRSFCERLDGAADRPRFKAMLDAGRAAMSAVLDGQPLIEAVQLPSTLKTWSNPHDKTVAARRYAVLLTDMIGSTDTTRKLGNSGAQRMLRAHNAIIRTALKDCKGTEVKHTGDGILAIFDKPIDAVEAARAIQQDTFAYVKENPDLPLSLRIGIEYGDGDMDGGEYYGPAFTAIEATCDAAGGGEIAVTPVVKDQSVGANTAFTALTPSPTAKSFVAGLFKLVWEPKRVYNAPPLEYRQMGTNTLPTE